MRARALKFIACSSINTILISFSNTIKSTARNFFFQKRRREGNIAPAAAIARYSHVVRFALYINLNN
jgi:hypothetical protein